MRRHYLKTDIQLVTGILILFLFALALLIGCEAPSNSNYNPPDDHTISMGGYMHKTGLTDPLTNCVECHGDDLRGGSAPVSCYECHGQKW